MRRLLHGVECFEPGVEFLLNDLSGGTEDFGERVVFFGLILQESLRVSFDAEQGSVKFGKLCLLLREVFGLDDGGGNQQALEPFDLPSGGRLPIFSLLLLVGVLHFTASFEAGSFEDVHVVLKAFVPVVQENVEHVVGIKHLRTGVTIEKLLADLTNHHPRISVAVHSKQRWPSVGFRPSSQQIGGLDGLLCGEHLVCCDLRGEFVWVVQQREPA